MDRKIALIALLFSLQLPAQIIHEVTPLDLGANAEDYAPLPYKDGFIMSSLRESSGAVDFTDARTGKPLADIYHVSMDNGKPGRPVLFSAALTTPVNEGPADLTNDGKEICYTRNLVLPKKLSNLRSANGQLGLFFSDLEGETWQEPTPFEHNSPKYSVMHPSYSADGRTLYFASDMPGGFGGLDLYKSTRTASGWSEPENLGPTINGEQNEAFPRIQANGTFYFSSDRSDGMGKLDIYQSNFNTDWSKPEPLPAPINSPANDVGYTLLADGFSAIMSSDRTGMDRIHHVKYTVEKFRNCAEQKQNNYCFAFKTPKHAATNNLPLEHIWDMGDGNQLTGTTVNHCYTKAGTYNVRSLLVDEKTGAIFHVLKENELEVKEHFQAFIAAPDTVRTGRQLELDPSLSHLPGITVDEYHWDLDDGNKRNRSRVIHQFKTAGIYEVKLDVLSMPDRDGLITNHCSTKKIVVMDRYREQEDQTVVAVYQDAFGRSHSFEYQELPFDDMGLAFDENADVVFSVTLFASTERVSLDDPRFMEIRKHFTVFERYDPELGTYSYAVGETKNMEELYAIFQKVKELQFMDAEVFAIEVEKLIDMSTLELASLEDLNKAKLRTEAIHFDFNSAGIKAGSQEVLEQVLQLLKQYPQLHVVIEAHTDDVGSSQANIDLAQQRAASVEQYLADRGIEHARMVPIGHGKNQPIASNKTEKGRSKNRRVEFRMVVKDEMRPLVDVKN